MTVLSTSSDLEQFLTTHPAVLVYFSSPGCGVCHSLKPRVFELIREEFPSMQLAEIDCSEAVELAAQQGIHAVPSLLVFFDGRETLRLSRNFSVAALRSDLMRPYSMMFD